MVAGAAAVALIYLRHPLLWAIAVAGPAIVLLPVAATAQQPAPDVLSLLPLAWLFGLVLLLVCADEFIRRILDGDAPNLATRQALRARWQAFLGSVVAVAAVLVGLGFACSEPETAGFLALGMGAGASGLGATALARFLSYGENFISRSNRMHESAQRVFDIVIAVARPRWGFATAGIALVFAVLAGLGLRDLAVAPPLRPHGVAVLAGGAGAFVLAGAAVIRDWRATLSCLAALGLSGAMGLWILALLKGVLNVTAGFSFLCVLGIGCVLLFSCGAEAGRYGKRGDDATIAAARTLVRLGPGIFFADIAAVVGLALWTFAAGPVAMALACMSAFAGAGALIFQPAFGIVIETWFPRPATIAARYRLD